MAFPSYAKIAFAGYSDNHANITLRTDMDRGLPKQRKAQSDVLVSVTLQLEFDTVADGVNFETWYYVDAQAGMAYFDWTDSRTGTLRQARVVAGTLGALTPITKTLARTTRTLTIEYLRSL
jgi:hypothetical protein